MKETFTAWAINTNSKEGHGFLGRYWWFWGKRPNVPAQFEGCKIALMKTRLVARHAVSDMKSSSYVAFPKAKAVKVKVTIETIEN